MRLGSPKQHTCPRCKAQALLIVNVKTESVPQRDERRNLLYRCIVCNLTFSVDTRGNIVGLR